MRARPLLLTLFGLTIAPIAVAAQPLGTYRWQLQPYCNIVTVNVVQTGSVYTLDGWDDQCAGILPLAPLVGTATLNPDGTIGLGMHIVIAPGGSAVHVSAAVRLPSANGTWSDSLGSAGAFVLTPGAGVGGAARPPPLPTITAEGNTRLGLFALAANSTGRENTASGSHALNSNTTGDDNTAHGSSALRVNTTGYGNSATGSHSLERNESGFLNVAVGHHSLWANTAGGGNTAIGASALLHNTVGDSNTACGGWALENNSTGRFNTAVGIGALSANTSGSENLALGNGAGFGLLTGSRNVYVKAWAVAGDESNTMRLGSVVDRTFIAGIRGVTTDADNAVPVLVDANGQLGTMSSSRRLKDRIEPVGVEGAGILRLRPVRFTYRQPFADGSTPVQYGLIAEEVAEVMPELVARSRDGQIETVKYHVLPTLLLAEVQRLERERAALARQLADLRALVEELRTGRPLP